MNRFIQILEGSPVSSTIDSDTGTYVSVKYDSSEIKDLLSNYTDDMIPNLYCYTEIHTTLMYSKNTGFIRSAPVLVNKIISVINPTYEIFGRNKDSLVISFDSPELTARHKELVKLGLKHSWDEFRPHITLSGSVPSDFDVDNLPRINLKSLRVVDEFSEPIKDENK